MIGVSIGVECGVLGAGEFFGVGGVVVHGEVIPTRIVTVTSTSTGISSSSTGKGFELVGAAAVIITVGIPVRILDSKRFPSVAFLFCSFISAFAPSSR